MTIAVTGATGHLGRLTINALLHNDVPAAEIVAVVRDVAKAHDLAERGVDVRHGDYDSPESLSTALQGVDRLLLISSSEVGRRVAQHQAVVDAAKANDVSLIAYTSIPQADTTPLALAAEHRATEELIQESGLLYVFLRNSWYVENYTGQLATYLEHGAIVGSASGGRVSGAPRADYAAAAAAVIAGEGHEKAVYELGGDSSFTMSELAATVASLSGREVAYQDMPVEAFTQVLVGAGLPQPVAAIYADADAGIAQGALHVTTGDLSRLIGRPTTGYTEVVADAIRGLSAA
jgi:NAD(P)H dehydrogenase (quinone)